MSEAPGAIVVTVGDELLHGETVDSNAAWLGRELSGLGMDVVRRYTVGDVAGEIRRVLLEALDDAELVILTGGLGPTDDDLTRPVVADALGAPLELDESLLAELRERFRKHGYDEMPASNESQAKVPRGAEALPNPRGTAPGIFMAGPNGSRVALLPGVPSEMKGIFENELAPRLRGHFGDRLRPVRHRMIHTTGISESELVDRVRDALPDDTGPVSVAFLPDVTGVDLRLTVRGVREEEEVERHLDRIEEAVEEVVEPYRYRADESGDLVEPVSRALEAAGHLLATAESCTGGLVAKRLTDRPGSSAVFAGGVVTYADAVKSELLGVDAADIERYGAVSETVARQMARGVARALGCACGVGITGIAGPEGGTDEKPVGLVWYAAVVEERIEARSRVFPGDRDAVRQRSAQAALALLFQMLREGEDER